MHFVYCKDGSGVVDLIMNSPFIVAKVDIADWMFVFVID